MTHFNFGVKGQGHSDHECHIDVMFPLKLLIIPNNVSQGPGKGGICVVRHFLLIFTIVLYLSFFMDICFYIFFIFIQILY